MWTLTAHCGGTQQKTLIRQFSNGEERLQKKQAIRNQDDSKSVCCTKAQMFSGVRRLSQIPLRVSPYSHVAVYALVLLKVYCGDHTYTTIRVAVAATGREVISAVADKLGTTEELLLVHLNSAGGENTWPQRHVCPETLRERSPLKGSFAVAEKQILKPNDVSVFSTLSINGRLFACPREQLSSLVR